MKETNTLAVGELWEIKRTGLTQSLEMWSTIWTNRKCTGSSAMQSHKAEGAQPWDSHLVTFPVSGEEFMDALVEGTQWAERLKMFLHLINLAGKRIITSQRKNSVFHLCIWSAGVLKSCVNITYTTTKCDLVSSQAPFIYLTTQSMPLVSDLREIFCCVK